MTSYNDEKVFLNCVFICLRCCIVLVIITCTDKQSQEQKHEQEVNLSDSNLPRWGLKDG